MAIIKLSAGEKKRLSAFFTCIVLAFSAWLFFSLSADYDYEVKAAVSFKNLPQNKAFYPLQSDTVVFLVRGTGWQLLFNRMGSSVPEVKVDLGPLEKRNFISIREQLVDINSQFFFSQKITKAIPDTLFFDFTARKVKRVPVRFNSDLVYKKQFGQYRPTILRPSHVTVTGPAETLQKIHYWDTDTLKLRNIRKTVYSQVALKNSTEANISIFPNKVEVQIPVDEFTEKELDIPIKVMNNPDYHRVKLVPTTVKLYAMVSLADYVNLSTENVSAMADLSLWRRLGVNKLPVAVKNKNPFVKINRIEPQQADFMILK